MAKMHTCVSEADSCQRGGQKHLRLRFVVIWVADRTWEIFDGTAEGVEREDI
jgi:hypothetical protein